MNSILTNVFSGMVCRDDGMWLSYPRRYYDDCEGACVANTLHLDKLEAGFAHQPYKNKTVYEWLHFA